MITSREFKVGSLNHISNYISLRHFGPFEEVNDTWSRLIQFAFHQGIVGPQVVSFGACPVCPGETFDEKLRYDACLAINPEQHKAITQSLVPKAEDNFEGFRTNTLKVGKTMLTVHYGPYSTIRESYADAINAGVLHGFKFDGHRLPTIEIYRNNPLLTKPEALITEIHFIVDGQLA